MSDTYNRLAAGERLRLKRTLLGMTQEEMAERIGRVPKYYADIERGSCGMSVETMIAISRLYHMSLDYLILGTQEEEKTEDAGRTYQEETEAVYQLLNHVSKKERLYAAKVLRTFLIACSDMGTEDRTDHSRSLKGRVRKNEWTD